MTGNTFTAIASPEIGRQLSAALAGIAADIADRRLPKLAAVVLGGGYGRGEGGVRRTPAGDRLCNDLDFFVFSDGANRREAARIDKAMRMIARSWSKELQVAIDFGPVKNLHALQSVAHRLMFQELLRGRRTVWGEAPLERLIPARPAEALPFSEAARLLLNRGMGLWQAGVALRDLLRAPDFILRNIYKAFLGGGDAMLLAAGRYRWKIEARR